MLESIYKTDYYEAFVYERKLLGTERNPDANGMVDYYSNPSKHCSKEWKLKLGDFLWKHVVRQDFAEEGIDFRPDQVALLDFPEGYKLWEHLKGPQHDPRHDAYLLGCATVNQFRSPNEFCLHLHWLMCGMQTKEDGTTACLCQYCDGSRTQAEISESLGRYRRPRSKGKDGKPRKPYEKRAPSPLSNIKFKDYTKLNPFTG